MPREPDPINDEELFDHIELGGVTSPGVVKLSGHDSVIEWDVKVGAGQVGATTTLRTATPVEFTATFFLADLEDIAAWPAFRDLINSTITGKGKALDVYHPDLAANGIKSVVKKSVGGVIHDGKGGQTIVVKLLEYKPPKPVALTPLGSAKTKPDPDPDAAAKAQIAALTNQFQTAYGDPPPPPPRKDAVI